MGEKKKRRDRVWIRFLLIVGILVLVAEFIWFSWINNQELLLMLTLALSSVIGVIIAILIGTSPGFKARMRRSTQEQHLPLFIWLIAILWAATLLFTCLVLPRFSTNGLAWNALALLCNLICTITSGIYACTLVSLRELNLTEDEDRGVGGKLVLGITVAAATLPMLLFSMRKKEPRDRRRRRR